MTTNLHEARAAHAALKDFFAAHPKGRLDDAAFDSVQALCRAAQYAVADLECRRAIRSIEDYSSLLHEKDTATRGADFVRLRVQNALASYSSHLKALESAQETAGVPQ